MRTKTKPKYVIVFVNKKNEYSVVGAANIQANNLFVMELVRDKNIIEFYSYEYNDAKKQGLTDMVQLTLMGPAKTKRKGSKKNEKKFTHRNRLSN